MEILSDLNFTENFNAVITNFYIIDFFFFIERKKLCSTKIRSN